MSSFGKAFVAALLVFLAGTSHCAKQLDVRYIRQPDDQTCLPSCLSMALNYYGKVDLTSATIQSLHKRTQYDRYNLPAILRDYQLFGLPNWYELAWTPDTVKQEIDAGRPVIMGVNQGRHGHFVLAVGYTDDDKVIINDPAKKNPGYVLGGDKQAYPWGILNWRGGCIVRSEDFVTTPAYSAKTSRIVAPSHMKSSRSGEKVTSAVVIELKNTGSASWPEVTLCPVDPDSSPTKAVRKSLYAGEANLVPGTAVVPVKQRISPGETTTFTFTIQAPLVSRATTFKEYWTLFSAGGEFPSTSYQAGPGTREISFATVVEPESTATLPFVEEGTADKPSLSWETKFGKLISDASTTQPPEKQSVFCLKAGDEKYNVAWTGNPDWSNYRVESWVYCDLRKDLEKDGWERYGLFIRDNGMHAADTKSSTEIGECITMCFDSDDGSLRCGNIINGGVDDFRAKSQRIRLTESGWHKFAVRCTGQKISYELDGKPVHEQTDNALMLGDCGIFYKNAFTTPANAGGARFAGFKASK